MDKKEFKEARDAVCRLIDKARLSEASLLVGALSWREGEPETVCCAGVDIPDDGGETVAGMTALLLYSILARHFAEPEERLVALDAASSFVQMLIKSNPQARNVAELSGFGQNLPELLSPPLQ